VTASVFYLPRDGGGKKRERRLGRKGGKGGKKEENHFQTRSVASYVPGGEERRGGDRGKRGKKEPNNLLMLESSKGKGKEKGTLKPFPLVSAN